MTTTITTRREWQHNPSKGYTMLAVYIDGMHCGFVESHLQADALVAEITAKREAAALAQAAVMQQYQPLQTAAYIAPRPAPRKAKVKKPSKPACTCPRCAPFGIADGVTYCKAEKTHIAYACGLYLGEDKSPLIAQRLIDDHRYSLLTHPLPSDLSPEAAADVLAARELEPTA